MKKGFICTLAALYASLLPVQLEAKSLSYADTVYAKPVIEQDGSGTKNRGKGLFATLGDVIMAQEYSREVYRIGGLGIDYTIGTSDHEVAASAKFDFGPTEMYLGGRLSCPYSGGSYDTYYEVGLEMPMDPSSLLVRYTHEPQDDEEMGRGTLEISLRRRF